MIENPHIEYGRSKDLDLRKTEAREALDSAGSDVKKGKEESKKYYKEHQGELQITATADYIRHCRTTLKNLVIGDDYEAIKSTVGEILTYRSKLQEMTRGSKMTQSRTYKNDKLVSTTNYSYDEAGDLVKEIIEYSTDTDRGTEYTQHSYDDNGNKIRTEYRNKNGKITYVLVSQYDAKGNKIQENVFDGRDVLYTSAKIEYDNYGRPVKEQTSNRFEHIYKVIFKTYDEQGRIVKMESKRDDGDIPEKISYYEYTDNEIREEIWKGVRFVIGYNVQSLDSHGNIIREVIEEWIGDDVHLVNTYTEDITYC